MLLNFDFKKCVFWERQTRIICNLLLTLEPGSEDRGVGAKTSPGDGSNIHLWSVIFISDSLEMLFCIAICIVICIIN